MDLDRLEGGQEGLIVGNQGMRWGLEWVEQYYRMGELEERGLSGIVIIQNINQCATPIQSIIQHPMDHLSNNPPLKNLFLVPRIHVHQPHPKQRHRLSPVKVLYTATQTPNLPTQSSQPQSPPHLSTLHPVQEKESSYKLMKERVKEKIKKIISEKKFQSYPLQPPDNKTKSLRNSMNFLRNTYLNYMNKDLSKGGRSKEPSFATIDGGDRARAGDDMRKSRVFQSSLAESRVNTSVRYSNMNSINPKQLVRGNQYSVTRKSHTIHSERKQRLKVSLEIESRLWGASKQLKEPKDIRKMDKIVLKTSKKKSVKERFLEELEPWNNQGEDF